MKQLLNSRFIKSNGFVFSLDASVAAIILLLASSLIVSQFVFSPPVESINSKQVVDSSLDAMLRTGFLLNTLDSNSLTDSVQLIHEKIVSFLPSSYKARVRLKQLDLNSTQCRTSQDFENCFPSSSSITAEYGDSIPGNKSVVSSRKVYLKYQPPADCNLDYPVELKEAGEDFDFLFFKEEPETIFFDFNEDDFLIDFNVFVNPSDEIQCDENVDVNISILIPETVRSPVDVSIVLDVSGSMSWGGIADTTDATRLIKDGNYVFLADGYAGLRSVNVSNPLNPFLSDRVDNGSFRDVSISGDYVFLADTSGTDQIFVYNVSDPENISNYVDYESLNRIRGLYASGDYVFVAGRRNYSNSTRGLLIYDASNPSSLSYLSMVSSSDPEDVFVLGDYAFLADGSYGLKVINVSNPSSPFETDSLDFSSSSTEAKSVFVDGNTAFVVGEYGGLYSVDVTDKSNISLLDSYYTGGYALDVFVSNNIAFIADYSSLTLIDVSNPSDLQLIKSIPTNYSYNSVWVDGDYAFIAADSYGVITMDWVQGPRIDNAKAAASEFLDSNNWDFNSDQMSLVSFNTSATLEQELTHNKEDVNTALYSLTAGGGTNIASGIYAATGELTSSRANPDAIQFQVLLSDGQSNSGDSDAASQDAANHNIKIFTIGFGEDADEDELRTIAENTDANYYHATDANVLSDIYSLIAKQIQEEASDSNLFVPLFDGVLIIDSGEGIVNDENIVFDVGALTAGETWSTSYTLNFPCNDEFNCSVDAITLPGEGTKFIFKDSDGNTHSFTFDSNVTLSFLKRDLSVNIFNGLIQSEDKVFLDVNVANTAELASDSTSLKFYLNNIDSNSLLLTKIVPALCGSQESLYGCSSNYNIFSQVDLSSSGVIYAVINDDNSINECPLHNIDAVNCYESPLTQAFIIDYFIWRE